MGLKRCLDDELVGRDSSDSVKYTHTRRGGRNGLHNLEPIAMRARAKKKKKSDREARSFMEL